MIERPVLPLFPLSMVVFPGQRVPLHIFEERYKKMVADCQEAEAQGGSMPFVIALQRRDRVQDVGCSLTIQEVTRLFEDGRMNIDLGMQRVKILEVQQDRPYFTASVQFLADVDEVVEIGHWQRAVQGCVRALEMAQAESGEPGGPPDLDGEPGSFELAQWGGLEVERRQLLLEMTSENERLKWLAGYFEEVVAVLERQRAVRRRGGSNGSIHPN